MKHLSFLLFLSLTLCVSIGFSQTGIHTYGAGKTTNVLKTMDQGYILLSPTNQATIVTKTDAGGNLQWQQTWQERYASCHSEADGTLVFVGSKVFTIGIRTDSSLLAFRRVTLQGTTVTQSTFADSSLTQLNGFEAFPDSMGGYWIFGTSMRDTVTHSSSNQGTIYLFSNRHFYFISLYRNAQGGFSNFEETEVLNSSQNLPYNAIAQYMGKIIQVSDGSYYGVMMDDLIAPFTITGGWSTILKFEANGANSWIKLVPSPTVGTYSSGSGLSDLRELPSGELLVEGWTHFGGGYCSGTSHVDPRYVILDPDSGQVLANNIYHIASGDEALRSLVYTTSGKEYVVGMKRNCPDSYSGFIYLLDSAHQVTRDLSPILPRDYKIHRAVPAGENIACVGEIDGQQLFLLVDSLGHFGAHIISGQAFVDKNANGTFDGSDLPLQNFPIRINGGASWTFTDTLGYYSMLLPDGYYTLQCGAPYGSPTFVTPASGAYNFLLANNGGSNLTCNFAVADVTRCPIIQVSISGWAWRYCNPTVSQILFQNVGLDTAASLQLTLTLDSFLTLDTIFAPYTPIGNHRYLISAGTLLPGQSGAITFMAHVGCDSSLLSAVLCATVECNIDTLCGAFLTQWDGVSLTVESTCDLTGKVIFQVSNRTAFNPGSTLHYQAYENFTPIRFGSISTASGQTDTIQVSDKGYSYALVVDQTPNNPFGSYAVGTNYTCQAPPGPLANPLVVSGFTHSYGSGYVAEACMPIVSSYDPNVKVADPVGMTANHFIHNDEFLEYTIHFQNTGNDTAFFVKVMDTLDADLDETSLQFLGTSHPCQANLHLGKVLEWQFPNIMLPDSITDPVRSIGTIKYRVRLRQGVPDGSWIDNRASIYFDYNAPVMTNNVHHEVNQDFFANGPTSTSSPKMLEDVQVFPNPFSNHFEIVLPLGFNSHHAVFQLVDLNGRQCFERDFLGARSMVVQQESLPFGIYFYRILNHGVPVLSGKVIAAE